MKPGDHRKEELQRLLRILFVENDPVDSMLILQQIDDPAERQHMITHVRELQPALDLLSEKPFDLMLLDLDLGDSTGLATFDRVNRAHPEIPVIVVTGRDEPECAAELLRRGAQDCLVKGAQLEQLLPRTIRYAVERHSVRNQLDASLKRISDSEAQLREVIEANSDAVLIVNMAGVVGFANRAAATMFGVRAEALQGAQLGRPIGNGVPIDLDIQRPDGTQGVAELRVSRTHWNGEEVFLASLRDVTDRVATEQALRRSEQALMRSERHLHSAQRVAAIGSFELDPENMFCGLSEQLRAMVGAEGPPILSWDAFLDTYIPTPMRAGVAAAVESAMREESAEQLETAFRRNDGAIRTALFRCHCLPDTPDLPARLIGVLRDITELREAQSRQAEIEEQLRHTQKLESLGTLAGGIAHDLNNTLLPITTIASLMLEDADEELEHQSLSLILDSANRAKALVKEILAFSRKGRAERQRVRLDKLVRDSMRMICAGLPAFIRCRTELDEAPEVLANHGQIYQIVLNLVTNAAQAIGGRPGTVTIGVRKAPDGRAHLFVEDTGPGMDELTQRRIFEPFFTTKAASDGTGLGLAVVSGIVADHGASIGVSSTVGKGTRFDLMFPVAGAE